MSRFATNSYRGEPADAGFGMPSGFAIERRVASRIVAMLVIGIALLIASLFCLGGMIVLDATFRRRAPSPGSAEAGDVHASHGVFDRLVGRWVSPIGAEILFSTAGVVWLGSNDRIGSAVMGPAGDSSLTVSAPSFSCAYSVVFQGDDEADWRLLRRSPGTACPSGRFSCPFTF